MKPAPDSPEQLLVGRIEDTARQLLETPDDQQVILRHQPHFSPQHSAELRATSCFTVREGESAYNRPDSRYVYLSDRDGKPHCILSLNLDEALELNGEEPGEALYRHESVAAALQIASPADPVLLTLMQHAAVQAKRAQEYLPFEQIRLREMETLFTGLIQDAAVITSRNYCRTLKNTAGTVLIESCDMTGNPEYVWPIEKESEAALCIEVAYGEDNIVYSREHDSSNETYHRIGDVIVNFASGLGSKHVLKDEEGRISMVVGGYKEYALIRNAERLVLGQPNLQLAHLEIIAAALDQLSD